MLKDIGLENNIMFLK